MFCLDPLHPAFNAVVEIVAQEPDISMSELHGKIRKNTSIEITLQHLYRIVTRMIDAQILLKEKGKLRVNLMWLRHLELFAASARKQQEMTEKMGGRFPLKPDTEITIPADTLTHLQALWYHSLIAVREHTDPSVKEVSKYYSHAWWSLEEDPDIERFYERIAQRGIVCYWLYGNDTFLDKQGVKARSKSAQSTIALKPPFPREGYNLNVHGDYIVECIFPDSIAKHLELLFKTVKTKKDYDSAVFRDVFNLKAPFKVKIRRDAKRARELEAKIKRYFQTK